MLRQTPNRPLQKCIGDREQVSVPCLALPFPAFAGIPRLGFFQLTVMRRMLYMPPAKEEVRRGKAFVPRLQTSWIEVRVQASNVVEQQ
jgi:hypothetical protein